MTEQQASKLLLLIERYQECIHKRDQSCCYEDILYNGHMVEQAKANMEKFIKSLVTKDSGC